MKDLSPDKHFLKEDDENFVTSGPYTSNLVSFWIYFESLLVEPNVVPNLCFIISAWEDVRQEPNFDLWYFTNVEWHSWKAAVSDWVWWLVLSFQSCRAALASAQGEALPTQCLWEVSSMLMSYQQTLGKARTAWWVSSSSARNAVVFEFIICVAGEYRSTAFHLAMGSSRHVCTGCVWTCAMPCGLGLG